MSWIAVAVGGAALLGGFMQSNAAQDAASTQAGASQYAADIGKQEFNTITQQESPYMQGGYGALSALEYGLGINPQPAGGSNPVGGAGYDPSSGWRIGAGGSLSQLIPGGSVTWQQGMPSSAPVGTASGQGTGIGFGSLTAPFTAQNWQQLSPGYNFQLQQGQQGVLNSAAAGQGSLSGAALKDLIGYNQGLAGTSFGNAFNMYQTQQGNIFNRLSGIAQLGQTAAANTGQQGTALTGQIGQAVTNAGTAAAAGQIGSANAWSGALSSATPWLMAGNWGGNSLSNFASGSAANSALADAGYG